MSQIYGPGAISSLILYISPHNNIIPSSCINSEAKVPNETREVEKKYDNVCIYIYIYRIIRESLYLSISALGVNSSSAILFFFFLVQRNEHRRVKSMTIHKLFPKTILSSVLLQLRYPLLRKYHTDVYNIMRCSPHSMGVHKKRHHCSVYNQLKGLYISFKSSRFVCSRSLFFPRSRPIQMIRENTTIWRAPALLFYFLRSFANSHTGESGKINAQARKM